MPIWLKKGSEKPVNRRHPWVFSGAVTKVDGRYEPGRVVEIKNAAGDFLAWGHYNPHSRIRIRLLDWRPEAVVDESWLEERLKSALERRQRYMEQSGTNAWRLVFSESDGLPGLIVDRYDQCLVLQAGTAGMDRWKNTAAEILMKLTGAKSVFERSDTPTRRLEGFEPAIGLLQGDALPDRLEIRENGHAFLIDPQGGQKTGFFLDQRENRRMTGAMAPGRDVLDGFAHTFAFSVYAAASGARSLVRVESSVEAAELGRQNLEVNGFGDLPGETITGDIFTVLRTFRDQDRRFDLIILDPPKFAPTRSHVPRASRAYKDVNLLAFKLLRPGGYLSTFSCSQGLDESLFQKIIFDSALDAGREARVLQRFTQAPDHPVLLSFPESAYLKGFLCQVD